MPIAVVTCLSLIETSVVGKPDQTVGRQASCSPEDTTLGSPTGRGLRPSGKRARSTWTTLRISSSILEFSYCSFNLTFTAKFIFDLPNSCAALTPVASFLLVRPRFPHRRQRQRRTLPSNQEVRERKRVQVYPLEGGLNVEPT